MQFMLRGGVEGVVRRGHGPGRLEGGASCWVPLMPRQRWFGTRKGGGSGRGGRRLERLVPVGSVACSIAHVATSLQAVCWCDAGKSRCSEGNSRDDALANALNYSIVKKHPIGIG
jgi:hypothetical protein